MTKKPARNAFTEVDRIIHHQERQYPFLFFNALGGIIWATLYGLGGYVLGDNIHRLTGPVGTVTIILALLIIIAGLVLIWRNERRLEEQAEQALPGSLDVY